MSVPPASARQAASSVQTTANLDLFWEAWHILQKEFYGTLPDNRHLTYAAIRGVLDSLGDPNTILVEPVQHKFEKDEFQGEFGGIGAYVTTDEQGHIVIVAPIAGTPADRAGLKPNDIVLKVDGKDVTGIGQDQAILLIRGPVGTQVTLTIQREGEPDPLTITLTREKIETPTVEYRLLDDNVGYLRISFFSARTPKELDRALGKLNDQPPKGLILDLRSNPGGLVDSAIATASQFLPDGVVAYEQQKNGQRKPYKTRPRGKATSIPLVVLINEGTASAAEIVAGALQDSGRAQLIGAHQSFGKGSVQIPFELSDGASLHVTIAHWLTPNGTDLSKQGLTPDIWVKPPDKEEPTTDPELQRALEYFRNGS
jgi:carboxyl-terminal processing protease